MTGGSGTRCSTTKCWRDEPGRSSAGLPGLRGGAFLVEEVYHALRAAVVRPETADFNFHVLEPGPDQLSQALSLAQTQPFFAEKRLVVVKECPAIVPRRRAGSDEQAPADAGRRGAAGLPEGAGGLHRAPLPGRPGGRTPEDHQGPDGRGSRGGVPAAEAGGRGHVGAAAGAVRGEAAGRPGGTPPGGAGRYRPGAARPGAGEAGALRGSCGRDPPPRTWRPWSPPGGDGDLPAHGRRAEAGAGARWPCWSVCCSRWTTPCSC